MAHGFSCSKACGILPNPKLLSVCHWSPLSLLWTLCPQLHCRSPHSLSFLFSLPPKKHCFWKEADLSSLTGIKPVALHWQAGSLPLSHQGRPSIYFLDRMPCKTFKAALKDLPHRVGLRTKWDYIGKECAENREWSTLFSNDLNENNCTVHPLSLPSLPTLTTSASISPTQWENLGQPWTTDSLSLKSRLFSGQCVPTSTAGALILSPSSSPSGQRNAISGKKLISVVQVFSFFWL